MDLNAGLILDIIPRPIGVYLFDDLDVLDLQLDRIKNE